MPRSAVAASHTPRRALVPRSGRSGVSAIVRHDSRRVVGRTHPGGRAAPRGGPGNARVCLEWRWTPSRRGRVSVHPSIWRTAGCRSHFFIRFGPAATALTIFGWVPLLTGLLGWCPLYSVFGVRT
ncbi:MAG TPA: DUF6527 family protein [Thermoanaerobaculia bacterium]|nr:DUF6527 family protein [Thermoanaerobaculia bacterium]